MRTPHFLPIGGKLIDLHNDLQGTLPPTVFAAAWALGQTFDLATTVQTLLAELSPDSNRRDLPQPILLFLREILSPP
jgi:hypothetical protein